MTARRTERVLVLRSLGLGDLLTSFPALRALRRAMPRARIELALPTRLAPLARRSDAVDEIVEHEGLAPLPATSTRPALAVNLHGRGPQSTQRLQALAPDRLWAYHHDDVPTVDGPRWDPEEHEVARWCRLLAHHGVEADPTDLTIATSAIRDDGLTVVHPGAADAARRWPPSRFAALARAERRAGRRVVVTGSAAERPLARRVVYGASLGADANLAGALDVDGLVELVATAGLLVCGDTGVAHVATATATPSVVLFGPTSPARWGPPPAVSRHRPLWVGRTGDPHGAAPFPGLLAIGTDAVLSAIRDVREGAYRVGP